MTRMMRMTHTTRAWELIRCAWLNVGFYSGMVLLTAFCILGFVGPGYLWLRYARNFSPDKCIRHLIWYYGYAWTKLLAFFTQVSIKGCDQALPVPCIIAPNHQSFFDAYCIGFLYVPDVLYAVRAWPFRIPFYRPFMRLAKYINTEELSGEELLHQGKTLLDRGASIVIFPEGTRSRDGSLQRFHAGAFRLATAANVPIVPLCIDGTGNFLRRGRFALRSAKITITALPPVFPQDFSEYGDEAPLRLRHTVKDRLRVAMGHSTPEH